MSTKKLISLSIVTLILYGIFFYELPIEDIEPKKLFNISVEDEQSTVDIGGVIKISNDEESDEANINLGEVVQIKDEAGEAKINIAGIGNKIEDDNKIKKDDIKEQDHVQNRAEVSISTHNPLIIRAGEETINSNEVLVEGIGIREIYELNGQHVEISGIKHNIIVKGTAGSISIDGFANVVRIEHAEKIEVRGFTNKVYLADQEMKERLTKDGFLNFTKKWNPE